MRTDHIDSRSPRGDARGTQRRGERGAVLVHVAISMIGLIAFNGLVVDYGILWLARRQAQNAADAAAMAGAISLAYVDFDDKDLARTSALNTAAENFIWGETPDVTPADVTFPACPPGSPGAGSDACIRVDVFRNQRPQGKPLPTFFGTLFGVTEQGVKATATAEVLWGGAADCVKPFAIPDKWREFNPTMVPPADFWTQEPPLTFEAYVQNGPNKGARVANPDIYEPPQSLQPPGVTNTYGPEGTGFTPASVSDPNGDYGRLITIKAGGPSDAIAPGWYFPVVINPTEGPGASTYEENIAECDTTRISPGDLLDTEPGRMVGPTKQGMETLMAKESSTAYWDTSRNAPVGCYLSDPATGVCISSSRIVAIPVFNPDEYDSGRASGRQTIQITKVIGFWIEGVTASSEITGRIMFYPTTWAEGDDIDRDAAFVVSIALVR